MPRFLYTIIFGAILMWSWFYRVITTKTPNTPTQIIGFLIVLGVALSLTLSIPMFFFLRRKIPAAADAKPTYRKALKFTATLASGVIIYLGFRAFNIDTLLNSLLLLVFYAMILLQLRGRR